MKKKRSGVEEADRSGAAGEKAESQKKSRGRSRGSRADGSVVAGEKSESRKKRRGARVETAGQDQDQRDGEGSRSVQTRVIGEPVYVVGNSLGGFVALYFAACNPGLVKGVTLLNATPFWGFLPNPIRSPRWQKISEPRNIEEILKQVYADHSTKIDGVFSRIVEITQHPDPAAAASFTSIMFAPRSQLSFEEALIRARRSNLLGCGHLAKTPCLHRAMSHIKVWRSCVFDS
ncbi:hypothetical protein KSP40_PGU009768 [Platanthera guangdongensis]|uniref:AB hydrolase-1 domain-containing protein n=1 Tax=Platanthera guangdongensis TaxID=2320717 RepID=A0ABR2LUW8_9ASPA